MPMPTTSNDDPNDPYAGLIWVRDVKKPRAEGGYDRSDGWVYDQFAAGTLHKKEVPGDPKTYLLRSEIEELLRVRDRPQQMSRGQQPRTQES